MAYIYIMWHIYGEWSFDSPYIYIYIYTYIYIYIYIYAYIYIYIYIYIYNGIHMGGGVLTRPIYVYKYKTRHVCIYK